MDPFRIKSGLLRHRIDIETPILVTNSLGESTAIWAPWAEGVPASIDELSGAEFWGQQEVMSNLFYRLRFRYIPAQSVAAVLQSGDETANNAILWTAKTKGTDGNIVTVTLVNPGAAHALEVSVSDSDITVTLAYNFAIASTAADVIAAVLASAEASDLVTPDNYLSSTGLGLMTALSQTALDGGAGLPLDSRMLIVWGTKTMNITNVLDVDGRRKVHELRAYEAA